MVGAGDSAIENALALAEQNDVWILNRGKEFSRAKDANLSAVVAAIADPRRRLNCYYETTNQAVSPPGRQVRPPLTVVLQTAAGEKPVQCHRIIARLGAIPPRKFVESIGIKFPNERSDAIPELIAHYESNVPGVYVIGSLAGYPLIKQAMNQGYDVVEFIHGNDVKPADHPLLEYQFHGLPFERPRRRDGRALPDADSDVPRNELARVSRTDHRERPHRRVSAGRGVSTMRQRKMELLRKTARCEGSAAARDARRCAKARRSINPGNSARRSSRSSTVK